MTLASSFRVTDAQSAQTDAPPRIPPVTDRAVESCGASTSQIDASWVSNIEYVHVKDDPRTWSPKLKASILCMAFSASMVAGLGTNILNPAIKQIETDLKATSGQVSPVLGVFIILQGVGPLLWCPISEIKGRKPVYIASIVISLIGCITAAKAKTIEILVGMRAVQAIGSSCFITIGAATVVDVYEPAERGKMVGIFYTAPLLGPSLGPLLGGVLTQAFSWRATLWLLAAILSIKLVMFTLFFRETFRCERSLTYRCAFARRRSIIVSQTVRACDATNPRGKANFGDGPTLPSSSRGTAMELDVQAKITLSLADVNPFPPLLSILRRQNNITTLFSSGFLFAFGISIAFTCSRTLADAYGYDALKTGLVLLSFGAGCILGTLFGGRWSDRELRRLTYANGGHHSPEMRLESMKPASLFLPLTCIAYAWLAQKHVHVFALCISLFFLGFFSIWIYSSTLAYIVDANPGRSSAAVAANSCFRGVFAFAFTLAAVPLQDSLGDGGLYTLWAGFLVICELLLLLVQVRGGAWRMAAEECEKGKAES